MFRPNMVKNDYVKLNSGIKRKQSVFVIEVNNMWHLNQRRLSKQKKMLLLCGIKCRLKCSDKFTENKRKDIFKSFIGDLATLKGNDHLLVETYSLYCRHIDTVEIQKNHGSVTMHFIFTMSIKKLEFVNCFSKSL